MKYILLALLIPQFIFAQDFEFFQLPQDTFLNGQDLSGGFEYLNLDYPNAYNTEWDSWSGWSVSTMTDTVTRGFANQYSCISGSGVDGSAHYMTSFVLGETTILSDTGFDPVVGDQPGILEGIYLNNATYTYYSMLEGDAFAKKFGGADGTDPDYFYVSIKDNNNPQDSVIFFLADFRSDTPEEDYIIKDWTYVPLPGFSDTISFTLYSSDVGAFGMNTPAYFCMDNAEFNWPLDSTNELESNIKVYPNPSAGIVNILTEEDRPMECRVYDIHSRWVRTVSISDQQVDLSELKEGIYLLQLIQNSEILETVRLMKF